MIDLLYNTDHVSSYPEAEGSAPEPESDAAASGGEEEGSSNIGDSPAREVATPTAGGWHVPQAPADADSIFSDNEPQRHHGPGKSSDDVLVAICKICKKSSSDTQFFLSLSDSLNSLGPIYFLRAGEWIAIHSLGIGSHWSPLVSHVPVSGSPGPNPWPGRWFPLVPVGFPVPSCQ